MPTDATHVDAVSTPLVSAGAGTPGTSLLASPADHVHPAGSGGASVGWLSAEMTRLAAASGIDPAKIAFRLYDFDKSNNTGGLDGEWFHQNAGTGTNSLLTGVPGGVRRNASGATAGSSALSYSGTTGATREPLLLTPGSRCGVSIAFRVPTAIDSEVFAVAGVITDDSNNAATMGVRGPSSTTNYVLGWTGSGIPTFVASTIPIDVGWHTCRFGYDGATAVNFSCDSEADVPAIVTAMNAAIGPCIFAINGATAADRQIDVDAILLCWERG